MKLPWQKNEDTPETESLSGGAPEADQTSGQPLPKGYTPPKGRPTPKRREVEIERGVIRPAGGVQSQATLRERRKELKASMSKDEWKEYKRKERDDAAKSRREAQVRMDKGDERYLLPRDQGPERRFVRDWVDSRSFINSWVMPVALVLLVVMLVGTWAPTFANIVSMFAMVLIVVFAIEGVILGRRAAAAVRKKFPDTNVGGFSMGFYAYSRVTQPRRWRTPKPQVEAGSKIEP
ncbi:hypothetical protein COCCU_09580 [Corynebacterium occultum]|uniref:DUF3043 domain-containing protein n=1 Tax=Corynebacterium occultum TaxID=2675219 RepID=A0A6B8WCX0_9CORY|nr:DUF3043 domain-containing protein [Corynebacterium occultum]QGU07840.1 hypothetical protein COCCU_09580 [Corynebacterium occultum]